MNVNEQVLVVDDESSMRKLISSILSDYCTVSSAGSAAEALSLIEKQRPDLVITDIKMPGEDGMELLARIRKIDSEIPVILLTGHGDKELAIQALKENAFDFMEKPFEDNDLIASVQKGLEMKNLRRSNKDMNERLMKYNSDLEHLVKERSAKLLQSEEELSTIFNSSKDAICFVECIANADFKIIRANNEFLSVRNLKSLPSTSRLKDLYLANVVEYIKHVEQAKKSGEMVSFEIINMLESGDKIHEVRIIPVLGDADIIQKLVIFERDRTEEKRVENQTRQIQKMEAVTRLAAGIAHDFNNILTIIQAAADLLMLDRNTPESSKENLKLILESSSRAAKLTKHLVSYSRLQFAKPIYLDLKKSIENMEKTIRHILGNSNKVEIMLSSEEPFIMADQGQIEQVLANLAVNSRDAMVTPGAFAITLTDQLGTQDKQGIKGVKLTVTDTGGGMDKETLRKICEPFFTTKDVGKGTGLGLSIVYSIVEQVGGTLEIISEKGKGATFNIWFPVAAHEPKNSETQALGEDGILIHPEVVRNKSMLPSSG